MKGRSSCSALSRPLSTQPLPCGNTVSPASCWGGCGVGGWCWGGARRSFSRAAVGPNAPLEPTLEYGVHHGGILTACFTALSSTHKAYRRILRALVKYNNYNKGNYDCLLKGRLAPRSKSLVTRVPSNTVYLSGRVTVSALFFFYLLGGRPLAVKTRSDVRIKATFIWTIVFEAEPPIIC